MLHYVSYLYIALFETLKPRYGRTSRGECSGKRNQPSFKDLSTSLDFDHTSNNTAFLVYVYNFTSISGYMLVKF